MRYLPRVADAALTDALKRAGAVLIEGPKACGKTATALQVAQSVLRVNTDPGVPAAMEVEPSLLLEGSTPRLIDEWQEQPALWDVVRNAVDERQAKGQFILTGSTAPSELVARHSGAGRFARLVMSTMTLQESGHSSEEVSLRAVIAGESPRAADSGLRFRELMERIAVGGWPGNLGLSAEQSLANNRDYLRTVAEIDISTPDGKRRDPIRVLALLHSLARAVGTEMTVATMATDANLTRDTVMDYLDALGRIFIHVDQPAWALQLRSRTPLRKAPKRHFVDPALAVAALDRPLELLLEDVEYAGQLFESFVIHELRCLLGNNNIAHARLQSGLEVDAIFDVGETTVICEAKLGHSQSVVDSAASNLLAFREHLPAEPIAIVFTGGGLSYRRPDGVNVISISALKE